MRVGHPIKDSMAVLARAKINLTLHVGRAISAGDFKGYHPVDSLVVFADFGDKLVFEENETESFHIIGPFAQGLTPNRDNLVSRALSAAKAPPLAVTLEKNIPVSAGLGGGSANAAAILRCFDTKQAVNAAAMGADIPVCRLSQTALMQGVGERVTPLPSMGQVHALLVNPGIAVSTAAIFKAFDAEPHAAEPMRSQLSGPLLTCAQAGRNDLEPIALKIAPEIADVLSAINKTPSCDLARMSGSGATCYGLYPDARSAQSAAKSLKKHHPKWWVRSCILGESDTKT